MISKDALEKLMEEIFNCPEASCEYKSGWEDFSMDQFGEVLSPPQWLFWGRNKYPSKKEIYYTLYNYDGRSNIVFIALRPSTGFIDNRNILFARALMKLNLMREVYEYRDDTFIFYEGCFITDIIKCRGKVGKVKRVPRRCLSFLRKELEIVEKTSGKKPKVIAIGEDAYRLLKRYSDELGIDKDDIGKIMHYSQRRKLRLNEYIKKLKRSLIMNFSKF